MYKLAVISLALLSGCGIVKISVQGGGAGSTGSPGEGAAADGGDEASRLKKAYDEFDAKGTCAGQIAGLCARNLRTAANIEQRPHGPYDPVRMWNPREGANPDPEWIKGWDALPATEGFNEADRVFGVLGGTLAMKANRKVCEADYKPTYDALKAKSDGLDAKIDAALKEPSVHDRIHTLVALRPNDDLRFVGARFRLEQELIRLASDPAQQNAAAWVRLASPEAAEVRPLLAYEKEARWACVRHADALYSKEETAALEDEMKKAHALPTEEKRALVTGLTENTTFKAPFYGIDTAKVGTITRDGNGGTITFESSREEMITLGCSRTSNRVVIENNTLQRDKSCTYGTMTWANSVKLTFADLPKFQIEKGDEIQVLAEITDVSVKATQKTGSKQREDRKFTGKGTLIVSVKRGGNDAWRLIP